MSNGRATPELSVTASEAPTTPTPTPGTSSLTGGTSVSASGSGLRISTGLDPTGPVPTAQSYPRPQAFIGGPGSSFNSQTGFHGFRTQGFMAPTYLPQYIFNSFN